MAAFNCRWKENPELPTNHCRSVAPSVEKRASTRVTAHWFVHACTESITGITVLQSVGFASNIRS